jgi:hypothetical protein
MTFKNLKIPLKFINHYKKIFELNEDYIRRLYLINNNFRMYLLIEHFYYCYDDIKIYENEYNIYIFKALINKWFNIIYNKRCYDIINFKSLMDRKEFLNYINKYHNLNIL